MGRREARAPGPPYLCPWCSMRFRDWDCCLRHLSGDDADCSDRARRFMMEELRKHCYAVRQDRCPAPEWEDFDGRSDASEQVLRTDWGGEELRTGKTDTPSTTPSQPDASDVELGPPGPPPEVPSEARPITILQRPVPPPVENVTDGVATDPAVQLVVPAKPMGVTAAERLVGRWHGKDHSGKRWQWHEVYWSGQKLRCTTWTAGVAPLNGRSSTLHVLDEGHKVLWGKGDIVMDSKQLESDGRVVWLNPDPKKLDWHWCFAASQEPPETAAKSPSWFAEATWPKLTQSTAPSTTRSCATWAPAHGRRWPAPSWRAADARTPRDAAGLFGGESLDAVGMPRVRWLAAFI
eukprot:s2818_g3.t1